MPEASLFLKVDAFGSDGLSLLVQVQNNVADPDGLRIDASIDGTAGAMSIPSTMDRQRIGMRVYVDGTLVPELVECNVHRSRNQNLQTWGFTVPIHAGATGYAGDWVGNGVGVCKKTIDIFGVYLTSTGYHEIPLIQNGIADNESRESSDGALITYTGVDAGGRYDQELIDFVLPPGSGIPRDRVVQIAATRAGVTDISLERSDATMLHEFQMIDANFIPPCQELADIEGRMIQWDRSGDMIWRRYGSGALVPSTSRWAFTERNIVAGSARLTQPGELITEVTVEGDLQEVIGACGEVTSTVTITTSSLNGPRSPAYAQSAGSSYAANPQPGAITTPITVKVETFTTTRRCEILVYERRTVQEFYNPEVSRYEWNATTDAWNTLGSVYTDDNTDDDSPAYRYSREQWTTTEIDETWHYWLRDGFEGPDGFSLGIEFGVDMDLGWGLRAPKGWDGLTNGTGFVGSYDRGFEGCKIGTRFRAQRFYAVKQYQKTRSVAAYPYPIWEEVEPANGWDVLGSKESAVNGGEVFMVTANTLTFLGTNGLGYQTDEDEYNFEFMALKGSPYLYGDDTERAGANETLRYVGSVLTRFLGNGKENHDEIVTETDWDDRTVETVATTGLASYLPAAERIPDSGPTLDTDVYADDAEQAELYQKAYRTKSRPISVTVTDDTLEQCSTRGVHKVSYAYLESEDEADWIARWLMDEGSAGKFECELAGANFYVEPGDWCSNVQHRKIGLAGCAGRIEDVSWNWRAGQPLNTKVEIILYP